MKSALQFHPYNETHFQLNFTVEFEQAEQRAFKSRGSQLSVDFSSIQIPFKLFNQGLKACTSKTLSVSQNLDMSTRWALSSCWQWTYVEPNSLRHALVFGRQIQHLIEDTIILAYPMSQAIGFTKTFDVKFEIPREIRNFESYRRSIVIR